MLYNNTNANCHNIQYVFIARILSTCAGVLQFIAEQPEASAQRSSQSYHQTHPSVLRQCQRHTAGE